MTQRLPIYEIEDDIAASLPEKKRIIVSAPTGSGKSTQVPQILLDHGLLGDGRVMILQPRRLAARLLAKRVAEERGCQLGGEVGYQVRLENRSSESTKILYVTEGILLRHLLSNPLLDGISAILFDEFHERHLYGDVTLGRALQVQESMRQDLMIGVMSATLDIPRIREYLDPCDVLASEGRTFPVDIEYLERKVDLKERGVWDVATNAFEKAAADTEGDVLIFMPGAYEITRTVESLHSSSAARGCVILPLHGELPNDAQDAAVANYDKRKIVVATNVAETSLTIDGVRTVIDSGLARIPRYDSHRGINTLLIEKISQASCDQRAGRAGRTAPGTCIRLWTEREHPERRKHELPEIKRLDLSEIVLTLMACGVPDVRKFPWLESPDEHSLERALTLLNDLGAVSADGKEMTRVGLRMVAFPVHPRYARMLLAADEYECVNQAALIAALCQGRSILIRNPGKQVAERRDELFGNDTRSDLLILMRAWQYAKRSNFDVGRCKHMGIHAGACRQAASAFEQFKRLAEKENLIADRPPAGEEAIQKCILTGFSDHLAMRFDMGTLRCAVVHGRKGTLERDSVVRDSRLLVAAEIHEIEGRQRDLNVRLSLATAIEDKWLKEIYPDDFEETERVRFDETQRAVVSERQTRFRDLILESRAGSEPSAEAAAALLAKEVSDGNLVLKNWNAAVDHWIVRVNCLSAWRADWAIPPITDEDRHSILEQICLGAVRYKEIKDKQVMPVVKAWLTQAQQSLVEKYAPERIKLPSGKNVKVKYAEGEQPSLSARIQDLYGTEGPLFIADGSVRLLIHVQGPNHRDVQITDDLSGFWKDAYPAIRKELQRKYPKHEWR
ncbi:MAG: ATP-dependent helicase HrpB [Verrucomicrobia bacterium]|nr:ATP-dependent helicase HrpB [Verrucomicrobiota bacterium]